MKLKTILLLAGSHLSIGILGFMLGIYLLPILIAPAAPTEIQIKETSAQAQYTGEFVKELADSDAFHWGQGIVSLSPEFITFKGSLAPGPDYKLYLATEFVETEAHFNRLKPTMLRVGEVKTFENFVVKLSGDVALSQYNTVIVWCETFGEFITAAQYR